MNIIITGATGFIGTNVAKQLLQEHHTVLGIDNFYCSPQSRLDEFASYQNFSFIEHDIISPLILPKNFIPDIICNLACPASPVQYTKDPIYTTKTSVYGILNMLELARTYGIPLLHASTSEVYGDPVQHPQEEHQWGNVNPLGIRSCYDEGKRVAESLCFDYYRTYNIPIKVVRIFNTYGPHMMSNDGRVISNFIMQALQGVPLTVYGDGSQTRSFCYIDDLVQGIINFMFLSGEHKPEPGPINLGNPSEITIQELVTYIDKHIPNIEIIHRPLPEDDPKKRLPNIAKAQKILAWSPKIPLETGLEHTIQWFKKNYSDRIHG